MASALQIRFDHSNTAHLLVERYIFLLHVYNAVWTSCGIITCHAGDTGVVLPAFVRVCLCVRLLPAQKPK